MSETIKCPDCGHMNAAGSASCSVCNFPLDSAPELVAERARTDSMDAGHAFAMPAGGSVAAAPPAGSDAPPAAPVEESVPEIMFPRRPRRRPPRGSNEALSLWLIFGFIAAAAVTFIAVKANVERASLPVEGSTPQQQESVDQLRAELDKDSTNVENRIALANVLYDTANWSDAIVHYRSAIHKDSSRVHALVDLGVCYYNLGDSRQAQDLFLLALKRDPHQPVALYNLGIVNERRSNFPEALRYYHRALQSSPPEEMKQALIEAMQRVQQATGKSAPPLPDGGG